MSNPIYTFKCSVCETEHERPGKAGEAPPATVSCPECMAVCYRAYRVPGVSYVGDGWTGAQRKDRK